MTDGTLKQGRVNVVVNGGSMLQEHSGVQQTLRMPYTCYAAVHVHIFFWAAFTELGFGRRVAILQ